MLERGNRTLENRLWSKNVTEVSEAYFLKLKSFKQILKEEVGGSIPGYEISSLLDKNTC